MQLIQKDSTDITLAIRLRDAFNGSPKTGLTITDLQTRYIRVENDNDVTISAWVSLTALGALTDAYAANYGYEIGEGYYRIDLPDAAFAIAANQVTVLVQDSVGGLIIVESKEIQLSGGEVVLSEVVEGTTTLEQAIRLMLSILTGKSSGGGTNTLTFRDIGDSKDRLICTVDGHGNRTAVGTRDGA